LGSLVVSCACRRLPGARCRWSTLPQHPKPHPGRRRRHIREFLGWQPTHSSIEAIVQDAWEVVRPQAQQLDPPGWKSVVPAGVPVFATGRAPAHLLTDWQLGQQGMNPGGPIRGWLLLHMGPGMALYDVNEATRR
jgi:hypothetical protein